MFEAFSHDSFTVPDSVTAVSRAGLRKKMLEINLKFKGRVIYQDIQQITENGKTLWCAWYYKAMDTDELNTVADAE